MLKFTQRHHTHTPHTTTLDVAQQLTLPFERRLIARQRVMLDNGQTAGLFLSRGPILRDGDLIATDDGVLCRIQAACEPVSSVYCDDPSLFAKVCYHLGNRHTPLHISPGLARYQQDHVLDDLVRTLGATPQHEHAHFEPEPGAYGEHESGHAHHSHH